ncbi:AAA family ATPase [Myxococcota bacterium]|nr:AAA family ATPase [Myxococcota bacterium]
MSSQLHFFTGKGGVGKSTVVAACALAAQAAGERVLVVELGAHSALRGILQRAGLLEAEDGGKATTSAQVVYKDIWALALQPDLALLDYVQTYVRSRRWVEQIVQHAALQRFFRAAPAVAEVLLLERLLRLSEDVGPNKRWDRLFVDLDATGHALMFLDLHRSLWGLLGKSPLRGMLERGRALLSDPARCRLHLVTLLQALPAQECSTLFETLCARFDLPLGTLLLNQTHPPLFSGETLAFARWLREAQAHPIEKAALIEPSFQTMAEFLAQEAETEQESQRQRRFLAEHIPLPSLELPHLQQSPFDAQALLSLGHLVYPALLQVPAFVSKHTIAPDLDTSEKQAHTAPKIAQKQAHATASSKVTQKDANEKQAHAANTSVADESERADTSMRSLFEATQQSMLSPLCTVSAQQLAAEIFSQKDLLVFLGSGGVGKTTLAASCAVAAAYAGRRVMLLTIDPAKRLADALGLDELHDQTRPVVLPAVGIQPARGSLHAAMLETQHSFDDLIKRLTTDDLERREQILQNRVYKAFSRTLARSHAYVAMERLYAEIQTGSYDLIVLDTPPTQNALEILDAPGHLSRFLEDSVLTGFLQTRRGIGQRLFQSGSLLAQTLLSLLLGRELTRDISDFFEAFLDLRGGFQERANQVQNKLRSAECGFVLVGVPDATEGEPFHFLREQVIDRGLPLVAIWLNRAFRVLPSLEDRSFDALQQGVPEALLGSAKAWEAALHGRLQQLHREQEHHMQALQGLIAPLSLSCAAWGFPRMASDICDVHGLARLFSACRAFR